MLAKIVFVLVLMAVVSARPQFYSGFGYGDYASYPGYYGNGYSTYSGYSNPLSYSTYGSYPASSYSYGLGYY